jgi:NAD+ diphosphatase
MMPTMPYVPAVRADAAPAPDDLCAAVLDRTVLVTPSLELPTLRSLEDVSDLTPLGTLHGRQTWRGVASSAPTGLVRLDWAGCLAHPQLTMVLARALQLTVWRRNHRFCGACREELADIDDMIGRRCPACGVFEFPKSQPVALVAVWRHSPASGRPEILLAQHTYGARELWALIGGYVDPAETLEQAAHREVAEEVGLTVTDLSYFGSEAWGIREPPTVLAATFTARAADPLAEPVIDDHELAVARYFPLDELPSPRPPEHMIANRAIAHLRTRLDRVTGQ